ncbi:MAG TPA: endonuclease [Telluria sp.]
MEFFDVAVSARARWDARAALRAPKLEKIRAGKALETESNERIQMRFKRLANSANNANLALKRALEQPLETRLVQTIGLERMIGRDDLLDINFLEMALAVARFVGRINILSAHGRSLGHGTGFMVSPRLLLTNNHVLPNVAAAQSSMVEFDYQNDRAGMPLPVVGFRLDPTAFFMTNHELDFTLVAVVETSKTGIALQRYGWSRLIGAQGKALLGEPLNVIQHPRGEAKQIVLRSNNLVDLFDQYAHYIADTEPGSSGSPVYNDQWEVVALHHSGVPKTDQQGRYIARDGSVWTEEEDPDALAWVANEGIRVSSLVDYILRQPLFGQQARLRDDLLELEPPTPLEAAAIGSDSMTATSASPAPGQHFKPVVNGNSASWTIPLMVTVQLGELPLASLAGPPVATAVAATATGDTAIRTVTSTPAVARVVTPAPELAEILAEVDRARIRPYYDSASDAIARNTYYRGIDPGALPDPLYQALNELLTQTHQHRLSYNPARNVYPWVDLQPGDTETVASLYSGKHFDVREVIKNDFEVDALRANLRESLRRPGLPGQETAIDDSALEAALPYNCEHVVPQSWFGKREPMRGDLHHLFTCESGCNSFRGNTPYFDFSNYLEAERNDCGKREENKFEPVAGKGAAARASLYFLLRYPKLIDSTAKEYTTERIETLTRWHRADPVTKYELHRNAAIQEKQGNRNPLIDFPDWVDRINFQLGLG